MNVEANNKFEIFVRGLFRVREIHGSHDIVRKADTSTTVLSKDLMNKVLHP
jgi:hypothetical protein